MQARAAAREAPANEVAQYRELQPRIRRAADALVHAVDLVAERVVELDNRVRDLAERQVEHSVGTERRHTHADEIRRVGALILRRHEQPLLLHAGDPRTPERAVARAVRYAERPLEIEHELDVV